MSTAPNRLFTIVGFILMKRSSCSARVRPPKMRTTTVETSSMIGKLRVSA